MHWPILAARRWIPATLVACLSWLAAGSAFAQQAAIHYVYDDLNRLIAVIDAQGNAGTYTYDAVGNILRVDRFNAADIPGPVGITLVTPNKGKIGTAVQIFGKGFSATPGQNSVAFNGTPATVTASTPNRIVTSVPTGATTGPITLTTPLGSATSPTPFTVVGSLAIDPIAITLSASGTQQFTATDDGGGTAPPVRWSVNDIPGGDPTVGTISTEGLYTAPAPSMVPQGLTVTVTATHTDAPAVSASASVTIPPPQPAFLAALGVSVQVAERAVNQNLMASVSVQVAEQAVSQNLTVSVGVQVADPGLRPVVGAGVGVQVFSAEAVTGLANAVGVSVEPVVASMSPASGTRSAVDLAVTITGSGLSGATGLSFLLNNVADPNITVVSLAVTPDGTQATAQVSISSSAALGPRVVQIVTPAGTSTSAGTGGNVFTVQ